MEYNNGPSVLFLFLNMLILSTLFTTTAWSGDRDHASFFFNSSYGQSEAADTGFSEGDFVQMRIGTQLTTHLGATLGYYRGHDFEMEGYAHHEMKVEGYRASLTGSIPVNHHIEIYGDVGMTEWKASSHAFGERTGQDSGSGMVAGAGVRLMLDHHIGFFIETSQIPDVSGADMNQILFGVHLSGKASPLW